MWIKVFSLNERAVRTGLEFGDNCVIVGKKRVVAVMFVQTDKHGLIFLIWSQMRAFASAQY